ncbi:PPIC-type PPIASE domain containing protein [Reticulomyxa filosa]|uniref:Peptidyl-prolyl cis-trans isomerase n=1 Tax=Reticulomyxa filosa TaxID=46433 RepID=X6LZE6_RETFI|nr:PPIC-type PPIASE domain containing protein [Reticulomyxa filosa]|eukprot:ETO06110.1 PPIC-type PPIASE domain containing protein [Reticulomyxa filosa]
MAQSTDVLRARHLLVKHKNSRNPVSRNPSNKEDIKKRSVEDADKILQGYLEKIKLSSDPEKAFAEYAQKYSDCGSYSSGGDLKNFRFEEMQKPFSQATAALKIGEISGIVHTDSGMYIIYLYYLFILFIIFMCVLFFLGSHIIIRLKPIA